MASQILLTYKVTDLRTHPVRENMPACVCSGEGELEVVWDKTDVVHMDDAMAVPATGGFYKSVAHHFYEVCTALYALCTFPPRPPPLLPASNHMLLTNFEQDCHTEPSLWLFGCIVQACRI